MSANPIYDETVKAQGFDPATTDSGYTIAGASREFTDTLVKGGSITAPAGTYELSPEAAAQIQRGEIKGVSIRKGGRKR